MADSDAIRAALGRAQTLHRSGQFPQAEALYHQVLSANPNHPGALHLLGILAGQTGRMQEAIELITKAVALEPTVTEFRMNFGNALLAAGQFDRAIAEYEQAATIKPDFPEAWRALARTFLKIGQLDRAAAAHQSLLKLRPQDADVHHSLAVLLDRLNRNEEAIAEFEAALAIRPRFPAALVNFGRTLAKLNRTSDTISAYRQAIQIDPNMLEAHLNLGDALANEGSFSQAIEVLQAGIRLHPDYAAMYNNLATALLMAGRCHEAIEAFKTAARLIPNDAGVLGNLASALVEQGRMEEAEEAYLAAVRCPNRSAVIESNYVYHLNHMSHHTPEEVFEAHRQWAKVHERIGSAIRTDEGLVRTADPTRERLRIGYVSADFRTHSVAHFIEPILAGHNLREFEVICFGDELKSDEVTARLRSYADRWHSIAGWDHARVAQLIRDEKIDILVDLAGHTGPNRLQVFAAKPAPIQITYLGYPNTTGLSTIDYRLTDAIADPPGATESLHSETLLRLPGCFLCYRMPANAPAVAEPPASTNGHITFGSFNSIAKTSPVTMRLWGHILKAVPGSRLALKARSLDDSSTRESIIHRLAHHGVQADRLELLPRHPTLTEHLASYGRIDIALDTFPYHGTTTTCEALMMGVPVISLAGQTHVSRVGASILTTIGKTDWIATSEEEYIAKAVALAGDLSRLTKMRQSLRRDIQESSLTDESGFVKKLETSYREVWTKYCQSAR